ncbi:MAG: HDOD domain-containing protein, partial [Spirochaetes bacterium]|nr:HDOD domain-containing protein [Spirochaetota bacterium]
MIGQKEQIKINRFIQAMPPLPVAITKILEVARDPNVDARKLNDIISLDPVLTGKVMKLINSAYYSLPNQITSIVRAIIMLGINTVKNLVLSTAVISTMNQQKNFTSLDMQGFWRHSICVGAMAKQFALIQKIDPKVAEEYFVAGL